MKRIVICFDGTWSKPADEALPAEQQVETNVVRFYESVKESGRNGIKQVKWYDEGVGSKWYDRYLGRGHRRRAGTQYCAGLRVPRQRV